MVKKQKIFHVFEKVYGVNLLVILGMHPSKVRSYLEKKWKVTWDYGDGPLAGGCVLDFPKPPFHVLWLNLNQPKEDIIPKIAHEVLHHVLRVCKSKGIPTYPEIDGLIMDEPAAYLMEFYMREIIKKLNNLLK